MSKYQLIKVGSQYAVRAKDAPTALYNEHKALEEDPADMFRVCLMSQEKAQALFNSLVNDVVDRESYLTFLRDTAVEVIDEA